MSQYAPLELRSQPATAPGVSACTPELAPDRAPAKPAIPRDAVGLYLQTNSDELWRAIRTHLQGRTFGGGVEQLASFDDELFVDTFIAKLHDAMLPGAGTWSYDTFDGLLAPIDSVAELAPFLPIKVGTDGEHDKLYNQTWSAGLGMRCAQLFDGALFRSLKRMLPRYADAINARAAEAAFHLIRLAGSDLVASCPLDRLVAETIVARGVAEVVPDSHAKPSGPTKLREVNLVWEGARDPRLWNWVRATPADATPEEAAAALCKGRSDAPFYAAGLACAGPLFGLPTKWALCFPDAFAHAPLPVRFGVNPGDDSIARRLGTLATSTEAETVSLQQAAALPAVLSTPEVLDAVDDALIQLEALRKHLLPWGVAEAVTASIIHVTVHRDELRTGTDERIAAFASVALGRRERLGAILTVVAELVKTSAPALDHPLRGILAGYAEAAGCAQLATTCEQMISDVDEQRTMLVVKSLQMNQVGAIQSMSELRHGPGDAKDGARELAAPFQAAMDSARVAEGRLMRGEQVDPYDLERTQLKLQEFSLRERMHSLSAHLTVIEEDAEKESEGVRARLASLASSRFRHLPDVARALREALARIHATLDREETDQRPRRGDADGLAPAPLDVQTLRAAVGHAQEIFDQLRKDNELDQFVASAYGMIRSQRLRKALVGLAIDLALAFATAGAANVVATGVEGLFMTAQGVEAAEMLSLGSRALVFATRTGVDAYLFAGAQRAMEGTSFARTFAQQALVNIGFGALQAGFAKGAAEIGTAEANAVASSSKWVNAARAAGHEALAITGHTVMGMALGSIADRMIEKVNGEHAGHGGLGWQEVLMQGASVAVGRLVHARIAARSAHLHELAARAKTHEAAQLLRDTAALDALAISITKAEHAKQALDVLDKQRELIEREAHILEQLALHPEGFTAEELAASRAALLAQQQSLTDVSMVAVQLHLVGLHELAPNSLWSGSPEQVERAVREIKRARPDATVEQQLGGVRVVTAEQTYELREVASRGEPAASTRPPEAEHELSNLVASIPGSELRGGTDGVAASSAHKRALLEAAQTVAKGMLLPGVYSIREASPGTMLIMLRDLTWTSIEVVVARTDGTALANLVPNSSRRLIVDGIEIRGEHVVQISERLPVEQVQRVVAHAFGRLIATHEAVVRGQYSAGALSPDDRGRIAEMTVLARAARNGDHVASAELTVLTEYLGIRGTSPEALAKLDAIRAETLGMLDVQITLETALSRELTPRQRALVEKQLAAEHEDHIKRQPLHDAPPSLAGPGQRITRSDLATYADVAARLRRVKSNAKVAELRAQAKNGHIPVIDSLQLGAGAALAGRDPRALLVDARGRWQADASENIAQVGQQLQDLFRARFGDVREVAGPGERVPLDAIRFWEDSLATQGDVVDGFGTLRGEGDKVLLDIAPSDGSPKLTVEVRGKIELAPGFPSERVPGGSFSVSNSEAVLELERATRALDDDDHEASQLLRRLHAVKTLRESDMTRVRDVWSSASPDLQARVLAKGGPAVAEALKQINGQATWNDLMAHDLRDGQRQIFFSKEANDETIKKEAKRLDAEKRTWVFAGAGGNAVSAAEIILANTQNAHISLFAKSKPPGLFENGQFRKMAELHGDASVATYFKPYGIEIDVSKSSRRMSLDINDNYFFTTPSVVPGENGRERIELFSQKGSGPRDLVATGDVLVSALGSPAQLPPDVAALALEARREHWDARADDVVTRRPVWVEADFTVDGRYIGYTVHIRIGATVRTFEVRGAASRNGFAPTKEFDRMPEQPLDEMREPPLKRIREAEQDAHAKSGNFSAGLAATALQSSQQHSERGQ